MNQKISEQQKSKPAYIYVRQSTLAQVRHHQESTERYYALRQKALELGWSEPSTRILDRDLGICGAHTTGRTDFKTLVADVSMGQVGAVFAWRLRDWRARMPIGTGSWSWAATIRRASTMVIVGTQGHDGASGVALHPRAPPGRETPQSAKRRIAISTLWNCATTRMATCTLSL